MNILIIIGIAIGVCTLLINRFVKNLPKWMNIVMMIVYTIAIILILAGMIMIRMGK